MQSGNTHDFIPRTLVLKKVHGVADYFPANEKGETYLASLLGWHGGGLLVGDGASEEAAIRRWASMVGATPAALKDLRIIREYE